MNWGIRIALLYLAFVGFILALVYLSSQEKVDLVAADYYAQELAYQDRINDIRHTKALNEQLSWKVCKDSVILNFPSQFNGEKITGKVHFFRASDSEKDRIIVLPANTLPAKNISTSGFTTGYYKMKIDWKARGVSYYNEEQIKIN